VVASAIGAKRYAPTRTATTPPMIAPITPSIQYL
jgi:hypothetical protein